METPSTSEMPSPPHVTPAPIPINLESVSDMEVDTSLDSTGIPLEVTAPSFSSFSAGGGVDSSLEFAPDGRETASTPVPGRPNMSDNDSSTGIVAVLSRLERLGYATTAVWKKSVGNNILAELYDTMGAQNISQEITEMGPYAFTRTFFTAREPAGRRRALKAILERILPSEEWTEAVAFCSSEFDVLYFMCKQWGIDNEKGPIKGFVSPKENFAFWTKALQVMQKLGQFPDAAKCMLKYQFSSDETQISWEQAVDTAVVAAQNMTCCVTLRNVASMETLMSNQMEGNQGAKILRNLMAGVKRAVHGSDVMHDEKSCPVWGSHSKCVKAQVTGSEFLGNAEPYVDYMEHNRCFEDRKMEFVIFEAEYAEKVISNLFTLHREFLKALTSLKLGDSDELDLKCLL